MSDTSTDFSIFMCHHGNDRSVPWKHFYCSLCSLLHFAAVSVFSLVFVFAAFLLHVLSNWSQCFFVCLFTFIYLVYLHVLTGSMLTCKGHHSFLIWCCYRQDIICQCFPKLFHSPVMKSINIRFHNMSQIVWFGLVRFRQRKNLFRVEDRSWSGVK